MLVHTQPDLSMFPLHMFRRGSVASGILSFSDLTLELKRTSAAPIRC